MAIRINVLAQQCYFFYTVPDQVFRFSPYLFGETALLSASSLGDYAVGAEVIAALDYGYEGGW